MATLTKDGPPTPESSVREYLHPLCPDGVRLYCPGSQDLAFLNGKAPISSMSLLRGARVPLEPARGHGLPAPRRRGQALRKPPAPGHAIPGGRGVSRLWGVSSQLPTAGAPHWLLLTRVVAERRWVLFSTAH